MKSFKNVVIVLIISLFLATPVLAKPPGGGGDKPGDNGNKNTNTNSNRNTNTNFNTNTNINSAKSGSSSKSGAVAIVGRGGDVSVDTDVPLSPAPLMDVPGFVSVPKDKITSWTTSPFGVKKTEWTTKELVSFASPRKFLGLLWNEWDRDFEIEIACWDKGTTKSKVVADGKKTKLKKVKKATTKVKVYQFTKDFDITKIDPTAIKFGEANGRAKKYSKQERQVAAAVAYKVSKLGARIVVIHLFSNSVSEATTAVLGAGAGQIGDKNMINGAGGFGTARSEKVKRAYVFAEYYR
jgi:hypothetical protein